VVDEAHFLKDLKVSYRGQTAKAAGSQRAVAVWNLVNFGGLSNARVDRVYLLTGTPMPNGKHKELFPLLNLIDGESEITRSFAEFAEEFCPPEPVYSKAGYPVNDPKGKPLMSYDTNAGIPQLRELLSTRMIRREKKILDLPEKFRQQKFIDLDDASKKTYDRATKEFRAWIKSVGGEKALDAAKRAEALVKMTKLRELAAIGKIDGLKSEINDYLKGSEKPLVVMAHHRKVLDALYTSLKEDGFRVDRIDGTTSDKQQVVDDFQAGKLDVVLCSVTAAGIGITLTKADTLFFVERVWRPFDMRQAEDRIHRIGQKDTATVVYYDAPGTIDEVLSDVMDAKIANADAVLSADGADPLVDVSEDSISKMVLKAL
jgi:SWI/SNF-related matrix-associated actin-dependent regulator 1 of chromatin subfamily A